MAKQAPFPGVITELSSLWKQLELEKHCVLNDPASEESILAVEKKFGILLPKEFKALYRTHDGQKSSYGLLENHLALFGEGMIFLSLSEIIEITSEQELPMEYEADTVEIDEEFEHVSSIVFAYDYQEEDSSLYILRSFKKQERVFYDVVLSNLQEYEAYGVPFGYANQNKYKTYDVKANPQAEGVFLTWLEAYASALLAHSESSRSAVLKNEKTRFYSGVEKEGFWSFHCTKLPSRTKAAEKE